MKSVKKLTGVVVRTGNASKKLTVVGAGREKLATKQKGDFKA